VLLALAEGDVARGNAATQAVLAMVSDDWDRDRAVERLVGLLVEQGALEEVEALLPLVQRWEVAQRVKQRLLRHRALAGGAEVLLMDEDGAYHQADPFDLIRAVVQALMPQATGGRTWEHPELGALRRQRVEPEELGRHRIDQPDIVLAAAEHMISRRHGAGIHAQHHGYAAAGSYGGGSLLVGAEVDVVTPHRQQALAPDGIEHPAHRAVPQHRRRRSDLVLNADADQAVSLIGPDAKPIRRKGVATFAVGRDQRQQIVVAQPVAGYAQPPQQLSHVAPAVRCEGEPSLGGVVPQHERHEAAGLTEVTADSAGTFVKVVRH
jgi:hypothetical protein